MFGQSVSVSCLRPVLAFSELSYSYSLPILSLFAKNVWTPNISSCLFLFKDKKKNRLNTLWGKTVSFLLRRLILFLILALHTSLQFTSAQPSLLDSDNFYCALLPQLSCVIVHSPTCAVLCAVASSLAADVAHSHWNSLIISTQWAYWLFSVASVMSSLVQHPCTSHKFPHGTFYYRLKALILYSKTWHHVLFCFFTLFKSELMCF